MDRVEVDPCGVIVELEAAPEFPPHGCAHAAGPRSQTISVRIRPAYRGMSRGGPRCRRPAPSPRRYDGTAAGARPERPVAGSPPGYSTNGGARPLGRRVPGDDLLPRLPGRRVRSRGPRLPGAGRARGG